MTEDECVLPFIVKRGMLKPHTFKDPFIIKRGNTKQRPIVCDDSKQSNALFDISG